MANKIVVNIAQMGDNDIKAKNTEKENMQQLKTNFNNVKAIFVHNILIYFYFN